MLVCSSQKKLFLDFGRSLKRNGFDSWGFVLKWGNAVGTWLIASMAPVLGESHTEPWDIVEKATRHACTHARLEAFTGG